MPTPIFAHIVFFSNVLVLITGIYLFKYLKKEFKILVILFSFSIIISLMELYLNKLNNLWFEHIYTLLEYSLMMIIFSYWQKDIIIKKIYKLSIPFFAVIWLGAKMTLEKLNQFDQVTASLEGLILVAVSLYSLYSTSIASWNGLLKDSRFWVAAAVLIYFLSNLVFFALGNVIIKWSTDKIKLAYTLSWIVVIFTNILYVKGFLCEKHPLDPFELGDSIPIPSDPLLK